MERTIFNPIFNDSCTFIKTSEETNGQISEMEVRLGAGGGNPMHRHTGFTETFTAINGNLGLTVKGKKISLKPGETITVQRGEPHQFFNEGDQEVKFHLVFMSGHTGGENMLRIMYGLARDGKTNKKGLPNLMTIAVVGEMGDSMVTGVLSLLSPILKWMAAKARRQGLDKLLLDKYCS